MKKFPQSELTPLALARRTRGWTQAYVAEFVGVSIDAVRRWESGRHLPYQGTIQKLCKLFQMPPERLGLLEDAIPSLCNEGEASSDSEKGAAWEVYIELVTRISIAPLEAEKGLLCEALASLYTLFENLRSILRCSGPQIAQTHQSTDMHLSYLVVHLLNTTLRPFLTTWHPLLKNYEDTRPATVGVLEYERQWEKYTELRREIATLRNVLHDYAETIAQIAGVPSLLCI